MIEKTIQDYKDSAKEIPQVQAGAASDELDPITETHGKAKAHDLTTHNLVVNEDSDGTLGPVVGSGTIPTGEADGVFCTFPPKGKIRIC